MTHILNGKKIQQEKAHEQKGVLLKLARSPRLCIIVVGNDPRSAEYCRVKERFGTEIGAVVNVVKLSEDISKEELIKNLEDAHTNHDGVMVQIPLPLEFNSLEILSHVEPSHDVDLLNPKTKYFFEASGSFAPPVALSVKRLLEDAGIILENQSTWARLSFVVVGQGAMVGLPVVAMFNHFGISCVALDKDTPDDMWHKSVERADVIVSGAGVSGLIKSNMVKQGAVLIDAGTSLPNAPVKGDIDPSCYEVAGAYSPVPGGVGPLSVAYLFENLITLTKKHIENKKV